MSTRKRPKAIRRPALALAGDPGDDLTQVLDDLPPWDAFTAPLPDTGDTVWYSSPAATAETAPMPAAPAAPGPGPEPEPAAAGTPVYDETVQGWGHIEQIRCAGPSCIRVYADPAPSYTALYDAARRRGWRRDAYGRDYCGRCAQLAPEYRTPAPVVPRHYTDLEMDERTIAHWAASHDRAGAHRAQGVTR